MDFLISVIHFYLIQTCSHSRRCLNFKLLIVICLYYHWQNCWSIGCYFFELFPIHILPKGAQLVIMAIWSYWRKHRPGDGSLLKNKSQICADGYKQCFWHQLLEILCSTLRMCILLSIMLNLSSWQVDYTQVLPQANIDDDDYLCIPQGFYVNDQGKLQHHSDPTHRDKMFLH
jgi:hypothetical protein